MYKNITYVPPTLPAECPQLNNMFLLAQIKDDKTNWALDKQQYHGHRNANTSLISIFSKVVDTKYIKEITSDINYKKDAIFLQVFGRFINKYCKPDANDETGNEASMQTSWTLAHNNVYRLIVQIKMSKASKHMQKYIQ